MKSALAKVSGAISIAIGLMSGVACAKEVTLQTVSLFQPGMVLSQQFERFIEKVNAEGKGLVQINFVGGASAVPPFEMGNAVSSGVVDMAYLPSPFYANLLPEAGAMALSERTTQELRENGGWELMNELHNKKMNTWHLARGADGVPSHLYVNKPVDKADLTGFTLRTTQLYRAFFEALHATSIQTTPAEVYTALERGVVDGYGWPIQGVLDLGWQEVTKARVDPGFYNADASILINLDKWKSLSDEQRDFLTKMGIWFESTNADNAAINAAEAKKQADAGMIVYSLEGEEREKWLHIAREAGWAAFEKIAPANAKILREKFAAN
ncbi:TRAP transporter substrate-binding protein DctP [Pusillimonas noertemannii]|uniref:TRAP-type C4-dicarboxylate transport system substrate-binding protein n=1 Tax=Pusillimonas noertemannii TaxID=305977 RepID=A0A2U1CQV3_9BURK|nr:TRAP transporter substrate-binding protein DctP [Pusillimonas noertemannii]NYT67608.1 TRAP transporter substrate-binding protein DctP [Pusillimonas noertemannii]PVY68280.1 TRAP-type C4-dicarboxylate transport system substrate-binding protein [Pusillimonas noertemannii]TFL12226.1 ABC transporter substrate-binding protein [Pusillimonas noertemannii]